MNLEMCGYQLRAESAYKKGGVGASKKQNERPTRDPGIWFPDDDDDNEPRVIPTIVDVENEAEVLRLEHYRRELATHGRTLPPRQDSTIVEHRV